VSNIVVTCAPKISPILLNEINDLGYQAELSGEKAVKLEGSMHDAWKLNFHLRTANRVLFQLFEGVAKNADELYKLAIAFRWEDWIDKKGYFGIDSFVQNPTIKDLRFANLRLKDAIADRFSQRFGMRPDSGNEKTGVALFLHWQEEEVKVYVDTTGESLSKRGYREEAGRAPLQETLAAAIILSTQWDGTIHFINPMCGSGTLVIEAALMAIGKYPGHLREEYAFMHLKNFNQSEWNRARRSYAKPKNKPDNLPKFIATDINKHVIPKAERNAFRAGVNEFIDFEVSDFRQTQLPDGKGVVVLNPEYGERMGEEEQLVPIYEAIGDFFKQKCAGKTGYIFTGNLDLAKSVGLKPNQKTHLMNGKIECRLLGYEMYEGSRKQKNQD
jgi:putative N6-adenine-specific DNA methylase